MSCKCPDCAWCEGRGIVWFAFDGSALGPSRCDDLDTCETCDECHGSGVTGECDDCRYGDDFDDEDPTP